MSTRTLEVYHAAHMLPEGPFTEAEIAELLMALFYVRKALPEEYRPDVGSTGAYEYAHDQIHDRAAAE